MPRATALLPKSSSGTAASSGGSAGSGSSSTGSGSGGLRDWSGGDSGSGSGGSWGSGSGSSGWVASATGGGSVGDWSVVLLNGSSSRLWSWSSLGPDWATGSSVGDLPLVDSPQLSEDTGVSWLVSTWQAHAGGGIASSTGNSQVNARWVELSSVNGSCDVQSQDFVSEKVFTSLDGWWNGNLPPGTKLGEVVGAPWWALGWVVAHLINLEPWRARGAGERGAVRSAAGHVVHDWTGVGRAPLIPDELAIEIKIC